MLKGVSVFLQIIIVYVDAHNSYPMVFFDEAGYEPPIWISIVRYGAWVLYAVVLSMVMLATLVFLQNAENSLGILTFHLIGLFLLMLTLISFIAHSYSHCSGYAYCHFLDLRNNTPARRCWLPSSLCVEEMRKYKNEYYLVDRLSA